VLAYAEPGLEHGSRERQRGRSMSGEESVETILEVRGEGGGYTILGQRNEDGTWRLRVSARDWTPALIGDDPVERDTEWVHTLQDALARINPGWYRAAPANRSCRVPNRRADGGRPPRAGAPCG
jgi:hypothetical protein